MTSPQMLFNVPLINPEEARRIAGDRLVHCIFGGLGLNEHAVKAVAAKIKAMGAEVLGIHMQDTTVASIMYGRKS